MTPLSSVGPFWRHAPLNARAILLLIVCSGVFVGLCGGWPLLAAADSTSSAQSSDTSATPTNSKLEKLRQQIQSLRQELNSDKQRKQGLQNRLRTTERHIGKVVALLKNLKRQLRKQQRELKKLRKKRGGLQTNLQGQRISLARQIRAAYGIGQQEYLKILLNQQDPAAVTRTLTYYDYFNKARLAHIQSIDISLVELKTLEQKIEAKTKRLKQNQTEQSSEKAQLETTRGKRAKVLSQLQKRISAKGERLSLLQEDKRRLQRLLDKLARAPIPQKPAQRDELASEKAEHAPFRSLRGRLRWPSRGKLITRYGSARKVGKLKWQGVTISAPEGTEVQAISHGRVAFSDWLRGFGLLIIIDHGDGYMSLYGGNQSLFKEVGDWVDTGELIAGVGNSGGQKNSALYFEIRYKGKPANPLKWCRNKPKHIRKP
ncbi:MAG: peptidoglycan DD-metalloendopeptidase family protein [Ectothiorhodospiraceae bacterium]|nr:peptidoglycan DD-metalloendopeptidase family protein [Ectothiorhodospiraceae bacterium]PHQ74146.1 MAG: peptidase M23 [Marinobacter sp.]